MDKFRKNSKKILVGILGGLVVMLGLLLVPYPGPGWLIVFGGLAILATEFKSAGKVLAYARGKYDKWKAWLKQQSLPVKIIVLALTCTFVLATLWLVNAFGLIVTFLNLPFDWLISPFSR